MRLLVDCSGVVRAVYDELIDLTLLGQPTIRRASHVEPDAQGNWFADLSPVEGPKLGPFSLRTLALKAERDWLEAHWPRSARPPE
ncbi:MAG: hypothetical protein ACJ8C4_01805 [Gemmataceae bacterium]